MKNNNLFAVILAGGSGTRFWPLSRESKPKQFLEIAGKETLFEQTLARIRPMFFKKNIFILTNIKYKKEIVRALKKFKIPVSNILFEPDAKNTAPAVCWAASKIYQFNKKAITAVLPSDHLILNNSAFLKILNQAFSAAENNHLMTLGIVPTRPETGYGYLKTVKQGGINKVEKFTEKPNLSTAKKFLKSRNYFWNSGMFVWKASVILEQFKKHLPAVYKLIGGKSNQAYINKVWPGLPKISIDYGILEKAKNVCAIPAPNIGWSDLGSWEALSEVLSKDKNGNIHKGDVVSIDSKNNLVFAKEKLVAIAGLDDVIVIDTKDALLICRKDMSQKVKDVVEALKKEKREEL